LTNRPFAGKDLPIRYRIFNVGSRLMTCFTFILLSMSDAKSEESRLGSAAFDVSLEDDWSSEEFELMSGLQSGSWAKIPA
jgi:hypothetical protein